MQLRDLPSVDELARTIDDPLAVDAARRVLDLAREEIRGGGDPGDIQARLRAELETARRPTLRRVRARLAQRTPPVVASTRIAERAVSAIPCPAGALDWCSSGCSAEAVGTSAAASATSSTRTRLTVSRG
jgi:hypothetical protein